ncbi:MAG: patatin-like phospholipase family protein [Aliivibrio sp.]|uniref:patatin-like phospholipase family protein n=1 Tax=Aliivibrio sp. TaxID=1872443 RepID=UPI001A524C93|nr:patatin-like phospholipase family protein [Aliivibrio sp.]
MNRSAVFTDKNSLIDYVECQKYIQGSVALVAQGGGQRGIFTSGVFDAFLESSFDPFSLFIGTSAGALNLCAFLSRQHGFSKKYLTEIIANPKFFNLFDYVRYSKNMDLNWAFSQLNQSPHKFDIDMARFTLADRTALAAVTNEQTLRDNYFPLLSTEPTPPLIDVLKATCAIPMLYPDPISINGEHWIDGGVSAAIPVQEAWRRGARVIITIRTEPIDSVEAPIKEVLTAHSESHPLKRFQTEVSNRYDEIVTGWQGFLQETIKEMVQQHAEIDVNQVLKGGRWLFGSNDLFRLATLTGGKLDSQLIDQLLVHYQTYELTTTFLQAPPDDCFVIQLAPEEPLVATALMSKATDLEHDYQVGLAAGRKFVKFYRDFTA